MVMQKKNIYLKKTLIRIVTFFLYMEQSPEK